MNKQLGIVTLLFVIALAAQSCNQQTNETGQATKDTTAAYAGGPDYFNLRPEVEKLYGYSHAVKIGNDIKISGAVSMDDKGNLTAPGSMEQQMKNCYADLEKILQHSIRRKMIQ